MECVLAFLLLAFVCVAILLVVVFPTGYRVSQEPLLRHIAMRFGGRYVASGWFRKGVVVFRYGKTPAGFAVENAGGQPWLKLTMQTTSPAFDLEISTLEVPQKIQQLSRIQEELIPCLDLAGDDGRSYTVSSVSQRTAELFLCAGVRQQLDILRMEAGRSPLFLVLHKGELTILKRWPSGLFLNELVADYLYHALRVYDQFQLSRAEGIQFEESSTELGRLEQLKCAVCGDELGTEFVQCKRCQAPHHLDCWNYNGSCGTYGCKETRYGTSPQSEPIAWYHRIFPKSGEH